MNKPVLVIRCSYVTDGGKRCGNVVAHVGVGPTPLFAERYRFAALRLFRRTAHQRRSEFQVMRQAEADPHTWPWMESEHGERLAAMGLDYGLTDEELHAIKTPGDLARMHADRSRQGRRASDDRGWPLFMMKEDDRVPVGCKDHGPRVLPVAAMFESLSAGVTEMNI